jgi:hypothetical protein
MKHVWRFPWMHGVFVLAAGDVWEQFEVHLKMTIE